MNFQAGCVFIDHGFRPALVARGRKRDHVIYQDGSRVRSAKVESPVPVRNLAGVTVPRLAREWLKKKNSLGLTRTITTGARRLLREASLL